MVVHRTLRWVVLKYLGHLTELSRYTAVYLLSPHPICSISFLHHLAAMILFYITIESLFASVLYIISSFL